MIMSEAQKNRRNGYKKITEEARSAIITRVIQGGQSMRAVAQQLGVNISTCKAILKVYQEEGRIGKKKKRNKVINVVETFSFFAITDGAVQQLDDVQIEESKLSYQRTQDLDKILEDNAKAKAEKRLEAIIENRRRVEEEAAQMQRQLQLQATTNFYYSVNPYMFGMVFPPAKQ